MEGCPETYFIITRIRKALVWFGSASKSCSVSLLFWRCKQYLCSIQFRAGFVLFLLPDLKYQNFAVLIVFAILILKHILRKCGT